MTMSVIVYIIFYCFFGINDIVYGSIRRYRHTKTTGSTLPFLCCVYAVAYASYAIHLVKSSVADTAECLAQPGGNVFYNLLVGPLYTLLTFNLFLHSYIW